MEADLEYTHQLVSDSEWEAFRKSSLLPGGFGACRTVVWPRLLHAETSAAGQGLPDSKLDTHELVHGPAHVTASVPCHRDERQIQLDTDRSFVLYPVDVTTQESRETLQAQLHELLISVFRKRPKLNYFQGYHDIITVIFLTLPPEIQLSCAEQLSLQRVRDSMVPSLEPVLGLLRVMRNVLRLADPLFASLLERTSPLPYFALSNLLTLFSHDMPTLSLVQHVFDYLLCRPPILVVYLATAIALSRKPEVERLEEEGEDGMIHSLLSGLPDISDEPPGKEEIPDDCSARTMLETEVGVIGDVKNEPLGDQMSGPRVTSSPSPESDPESDTISPPSSAVQADFLGPEKSAQDGIAPQNSIDPLSNSSLESESTLKTNSGPILPFKIEEKLSSPSPAPSPSLHPRRPRISLTSLLMHADELYKSYPPSHPSVDVSSTMGPQSVVFTWSEATSDMPDDDEAEAMVERPELIVKPYVEQYPEDKESESEGKQRRQRKLTKPLRFSGMTVQTKTMAVGAVVVLGVAMAVYAVRSRPSGTSIGEHVRAHGWRRLGRWVGRVLAGVNERSGAE